MPEVTFKFADRTERTVELSAGLSLMTGAQNAGIAGIDGDCGGMLSCATCHVYVDPSWAPKLAEPNEYENELLRGVAAQLEPTSRLSCQISMCAELDGLIVAIPERQS